MTLRAEGSVNSNNGTFRLEVGSAFADDRARSRVDADHDGKFWTSQLGANASANEVGTRVLCLVLLPGRNSETYCFHPTVTIDTTHSSL